MIHQAELIPVALALQQWCEAVQDREVLVFIDIDASRAAIVRGASANQRSAELVHEIWTAAARTGCSPWFARVASAANPADGPSRGCFEWCKMHGYAREAVRAGCQFRLHSA